MKSDREPPLKTLLRAVRVELGWSQQQLAAHVGTTPVNVSRWENGKTSPTPYFRQRLCEVYEKTPAELGLLSPSSPHGFKLWNMPTTRNPFFTGREHLLALLLERLSVTRVASLTRAQSLFGPRGIGKTQTATEFAYRYADYYSHVFWIQAASREALMADYVALAQQLGLPEPTKDEQYQTRIIAAVKGWLTSNEGWLLIMDNADDLRMPQQFLPTRRKGYVLFTIRAQAAGQIAASVEVEKLNLEEGTLLLLRWSKRLDANAPLEQAQAEDRAAAERIVQEMDGLPLALVQAGAYIDETGCSLADYLRLYALHRKELLERPNSLLLDYDETVATTWSLSFQQIEQQSSVAANVLRLCAFLAPDAIPEELLMRGASELSAIPGAEALDALKLDDALAVLRRYSLVRRNGVTNMLSIHNLVQAVLIASMDQQTRYLWAERTVRVLNTAAFPETDYGKDSTYQRFLPNVQECAALINVYHLHFPEAAQLLYQAGTFLYYQGFYPQALAFHQQALAIREEVLGSVHPDVANSLNALALLSRIQNNFEQAEKFHLQALTIRKKTLGLEHPSTVISLNNLGVLYRIQGKYGQAAPLLQQALNIRERVLGPEHPETLMTSLNLAKLYSEQRKYEQAEQLLQQTLATSERTLEHDHPLIAHNLNLLARLYFEQGNNEQAETLWSRSLAIIEKTYGPEHPAIAERLNDLAGLYETEGKYDMAEPLYQRALEIARRALGEEDLSVAQCLNNLAELYRCKGSYDQAERLFLKALAIRQSTLGERHPEIATSLNNLAGLYYAREDYARAEQLFQEALAIGRATLGENHPEVALQLNNLAEVYRAQARYEEAEALFRRVLAIFEASYGLHHPHVATVLNNLASTLQVTEHVDEAEDLYRRALDIDLSHFGPDHPNVATDLSNLATLFYRANRLAEAEELYRRALAIDEASLGHEHPVLGIRLNNLASTMLASHHVPEARALLQRASRLLEHQSGSHHPLAQEVREKLEALQ